MLTTTKSLAVALAFATLFGGLSAAAHDQSGISASERRFVICVTAEGTRAEGFPAAV